MLENRKYEMYGFNIQTDKVIETKRLDLVVASKNSKMCQVINFTVPNDEEVNMRDIEKIVKYQHLAIKSTRLWKV